MGVTDAAMLVVDGERGGQVQEVATVKKALAEGWCMHVMSDGPVTSNNDLQRCDSGGSARCYKPAGTPEGL